MTARVPDGARRGAGVPTIAIDLATLHPGRGGAGGGIWSYARHLVRELDRLAPDDVAIIALAHRDLPLDGLRHVRVGRVAADTRSIAGRLRWVHATLPAWCRANGVGVLHRPMGEAPVRAGVPLVVTVHDFMAEHYEARGYPPHGPAAWLRRRYFAAVARRALTGAQRVITGSATVGVEARRRYPPVVRRLVVVPDGVAHDELDVPDASRPRGVAGRVLCLGMFARHKGQLHAVRALDRLATRRPDVAAAVTLAFRGFPEDAAYHAEVRAAAARSPAAGRIRFVEYATRVDARAIYAEADVLLFASEYEGFGLPLLEAQAASVAVVCADIPVFREVAGDGACFVQADDPDAVADALARVATDAAYRATLVRKGRENARRYSWARTASETLAVYRAVLRQAAGGG